MNGGMSSRMIATKKGTPYSATKATTGMAYFQSILSYLSSSCRSSSFPSLEYLALRRHPGHKRLPVISTVYLDASPKLVSVNVSIDLPPQQEPQTKKTGQGCEWEAPREEIEEDNNTLLHLEWDAVSIAEHPGSSRRRRQNFLLHRCYHRIIHHSITLNVSHHPPPPPPPPPSAHL